MTLAWKLWRDDMGGILASEYLLLAGLLVFGLLPGLIAVRDAHNQALQRQAKVLESLAVPPECDVETTRRVKPHYRKVERIDIRYVEEAP